MHGRAAADGGGVARRYHVDRDRRSNANAAALAAGLALRLAVRVSAVRAVVICRGEARQRLGIVVAFKLLVGFLVGIVVVLVAALGAGAGLGSTDDAGGS